MSDCRIASCARRGDGCEVCRYVDKLTYTATRHGVREDYREQQTFSGTAHYCPKCGRNVSPWTRIG